MAFTQAKVQTFVAFARKRVGDPHLAEDIVQDSLLRALPADKSADLWSRAGALHLEP
jgi:DNA-directed RNA polymerase specialized sigma24 family protein